MTFSFNNSTSCSAISSLGVHLIVVVFAGNYILLQDRLVPPPNKTYKLEVIEKSKPLLVKKEPIKETAKKRVDQVVPSPVKKEPIKEITKRRVDRAVPLEPKVMPQVHTPAQVLTVAHVARDVSAKPIKNVPLHNSSTVSRQTFVQTSSVSPSFRSASVSPRNVQPVTVSNNSKSGKSVAVSANPMLRAHSAPARKMTQATVSSSSASKGGGLIQSGIQRISVPSSQVRAIQSGEAPKQIQGSGILQMEASAVRVSFAFEPRSVPNIVDQGVLRGYSRGIQRKIAARKKYPKKAKRRGEEGQVIIQFTLLKSGEIKDLLLASATPYAELNEAALNAVRRAAPFPSFPDEIGQDFLELELPFNFTIKK
jgi:TonB family protein